METKRTPEESPPTSAPVVSSVVSLDKVDAPRPERLGDALRRQGRFFGHELNAPPRVNPRQGGEVYPNWIPVSVASSYLGVTITGVILYQFLYFPFQVSNIVHRLAPLMPIDGIPSRRGSAPVSNLRAPPASIFVRYGQGVILRPPVHPPARSGIYTPFYRCGSIRWAPFHSRRSLLAWRRTPYVWTPNRQP